MAYYPATIGSEESLFPEAYRDTLKFSADAAVERTRLARMAASLVGIAGQFALSAGLVELLRCRTHNGAHCYCACGLACPMCRDRLVPRVRTVGDSASDEICWLIFC